MFWLIKGSFKKVIQWALPVHHVGETKCLQMLLRISLIYSETGVLIWHDNMCQYKILLADQHGSSDPPGSIEFPAAILDTEHGHR